MPRQDRVFTRTPSGLEQKYGFEKTFRKVGQSIQKANAAAQEAEKKAAQASSEILKLSDSITLKVVNGETTAQIILKVGNKEYPPATISMKGLVSFTALETEGETKIHGGNMLTDTLVAEMIKSGVLKSKDGKSCVIDLDAGSAELTGKFKTILEFDSSGNVVVGELLPSGITTYRKTKNGNNVAYTTLTPEQIVIITEKGSYSTYIPGTEDRNVSTKQTIHNRQVGQIKQEISAEEETDPFVQYLLQNNMDGTTLQILLQSGKVKISGLTDPEDVSDAVNLSYLRRELDKLREELGLSVG